MNIEGIKAIGRRSSKDIRRLIGIAAPLVAAGSMLISGGGDATATDSQISCTGIIPEVGINGWPSGTPDGVQAVIYNPTREKNRLEIVQGGVSVIVNDQGVELARQVYSDQSKMVMTFVYSSDGGLSNGQVWRGANYYEIYRTDGAATLNPNQETLVKAQEFRNLLTGRSQQNQPLTEVTIFDVNSKTSTVSAKVMSGDAFVQYTQQLEGDSKNICKQPTPRPTNTPTAVPTTYRLLFPRATKEFPELLIPQEIRPLLLRLPNHITYLGSQYVTRSKSRQQITIQTGEILLLQTDQVSFIGLDNGSSVGYPNSVGPRKTQLFAVGATRDNATVTIETLDGLYSEVVKFKTNRTSTDDINFDTLSSALTRGSQVFEPGNCGLQTGCEGVMVSAFNTDILRPYYQSLYDNSAIHVIPTPITQP